MSKMERLDPVARWQFLSAAVLGILAIASIWWVLDAHPVPDDQGSRATFAGWLLALLPLVAAALACTLGVRRVRARPSGPASAPQATGAGGVAATSVKQVNKDGGKGFIGGQHHHDHRP